MPTPVINDVFRVVLLWEPLAGISPRNVLHMRTALTDVTAIAGFINDAFQTAETFGNTFHPMHSGQDLRSISVQPLDGVTAATDYSITPDIDGAQSGEVSPATCAVVSLKTGQLGSRGRGRVYCGPICETAMADGVLALTSRTQMLAGWDAFRDDLNSNGIELGVASYTWSDFHPVVSIRIDSLVGTQRRRQDQLR